MRDSRSPCGCPFPPTHRRSAGSPRRSARPGAIVTALDVVDSDNDSVIVDLTCDTADGNHADRVTDVVRALDGVEVRKVSDRTFLLHLGGKIEVNSKVSLRTRDELSRAYTPGVARVCLAIAENPDDARRLTIKRNTVAVVTDGSAVLGLGNLGPAAALPVMEGKAALFKRFAGVDAWPVCLDTQDTDEIVSIVKAIAPVYGGINLEDIAAPRCFEIEERLREALDIPVFHDDQHGTAMVRARPRSPTRCGWSARSCRRCGWWSPGRAPPGPRSSSCCWPRASATSSPATGWARCTPTCPTSTRRCGGWPRTPTRTGTPVTCAGAVRGSDVFIGVSAPNMLDGDDIATMADKSIVFALANPDPEVDPREARKYAAIVATGRSDEPNQINNVLAFPGVFRGMLDAQAREFTQDMALAASKAIADVVGADKVNASVIIPSVFDPAVAPAVAAAVTKAARKSGAAAHKDSDVPQS